MPDLSSSRGRRRLLKAALVAVVTLGLSFSHPAAAADDGILRWGGDATGGAPYIFKRNGKLVGFEVELADYLAARLSRRAIFVQRDWDSLPQDLKRGDIDCILNGYEWSAKREQAMRSTVPYYVYKLQLIVRDGDTAIQSWDDLRGKKVGVLGASAAENYLKRRFGGDVEISAPVDAGTTGVMAQVAKGDLAATVQDVPAAKHYVGPGREFPTLRPLGPPVEPGYYVIYVRREDDGLRDRLNEAIRDGLRDGTLRRIYEKYGLWDADQEKLSEIASRPWPPEEEAPQPGRGEQVLQFAGQLALAAVTTVALSFLAMPLAILLGLLVAVGRLYGPGWLGWPLGGYVEFLRGTPLMFQLFAIYYFVLPAFGLGFLPAFWASVLGLALNYSAAEAENYRAGLLAIPKGQMEAALSLGMSTWTALHRVIIPQAVKIVIPPVTNDFIALFKDTAVCAAISVTLLRTNLPELTGQYRRLVIENPGLGVELLLLTAALYLLMSYPLSVVARRLERRLPRVV